MGAFVQIRDQVAVKYIGDASQAVVVLDHGTQFLQHISLLFEVFFHSCLVFLLNWEWYFYQGEHALFFLQFENQMFRKIRNLFGLRTCDLAHGLRHPLTGLAHNLGQNLDGGGPLGLGPMGLGGQRRKGNLTQFKRSRGAQLFEVTRKTLFEGKGPCLEEMLCLFFWKF